MSLTLLNPYRYTSGVTAPTLADLVNATSPYNYWRLGESSGTTAEDETGTHDATYVGTPTLGATGVAGGGGNTAVTLNGSSQRLTVADLTTFEAALSAGTPIDVVFHFKTTSTAQMAILGTISTGQTFVFVALNSQTGVNTAGWISIRVRNEASGQQTCQALVGPNLYDGNYHQLRVRFDTSGTGKHAFWFDGSRYSTMTSTAAVGTLTFTHDWTIGARNNRGTPDWHFNGTLDETFIASPLTLAEAEAIRVKALADEEVTTTVSTPTLLLSASDLATDSVYWTRPYPNPDAVGGGDEYLWLGSTDHAPTINGRIYRGFSASPDTVPSSWTVFVPPGGWTQPETPWFIYNPGHARPYHLYYHSSTAESVGGNQSSRMVSHTSVAWESGTDEGEQLPATAASPALDHTGYMSVERRGATDWHAWSFVRAAGGPAGRAEYGYWTDSDGDVWTCVNDDVDVRSMLPSGRQLVLRALNRFTIGATTYAILTEHPDDTGTGGVDADPNGQIILCEMPDEETFTVVSRLWAPADNALADDLRDVRAYQDDGDPTLIHLYIHIGRTDVHYATVQL